MHITIFGAGGNVGRLLVKAALGHGHSVTAFVHGEPRFPHHPYLTLHRGDIHDPQSVAKAMRGSDAIISALGSWGTPKKDILSSGMQSIIPAMQQQGIQRLVSLTGADARVSGDEISRLHRITHAALTLFASKVLRDSEEHIRLLRASGLDWMVIRSPIMNDFGNSATYHLVSTRPLPWQTIHRASVVRCMIDEVERPRHSCTAPYISRH